MSSRTVAKKVMRWLKEQGLNIEPGGKHLKITDANGRLVGILPKNAIGARSVGNSWHVFRQELRKNGIDMPIEITKG